jgi:nucleotidyltransferase/DNA polymerase involved in DNA repair
MVHIEKIRVDRFGTLSDVQIDSLTDGLNVFYGTSGTTTATVAQFLRAMLLGFPSDIRRRYLPAESRGYGGALTVQTSSGRHIVSRVDDGSSDGRLTVQHADGRVIGLRDLRDFVQISERTFDRVFSLDFERRYDVHDLFREAQSFDLDIRARDEHPERLGELAEALRAQQAELASLPVINLSLDHLQHRRRVLLDEIQSLTTREAECAAHGRRRQEALREQIGDLEQQLQALKDQRRVTDQAIDELTSKCNACLQAMKAVKVPNTSLQDRLYQVESRMERWRSVCEEIAQRKQALQADVDDQALDADPNDEALADPRRVLRSLEAHIQHLQSCVADLPMNAASQPCQCRTLRDIFAPAFEEMRADVYRLCQQLGHRERQSEHVGCTSELAQLERCEAEMRGAIGRLAEQRRHLRQEIAAAADSDAVLHRWQGEFCQCHNHPRSQPDVSGEDDERAALEEEMASLELQIARLDQRREKTLADLDDVEGELAELCGQLSRLEDPLGLLDNERLADKQAELRAVERDIENADNRREVHQRIAALEDQIHRLRTAPTPSLMLRDASEYLRRLSAGNLIAIDTDEQGGVWVVDESETRRRHSQISVGQQDQVYLAVCLACVAAFQRRGVAVPLVLVGAFTNLSAHTVSEAAELLRDFAAHGHQLIVLTRFERIASVFRLLNVNVRKLDHLPAAVPEPHSDVSHPAPQLDVPRQEPVVLVDRTAERMWDSEEFPGELTDRVLLERRWEQRSPEGPRDERRRTPKEAIAEEKSTTDPLAEALPTAPDLDSGEFFLTERHAIEHAPSVDPANIERLRKLGIETVGHLLQAVPADLAAELRYAGITVDMIEIWQAQALLVCRVPRLRPYDARVLVACGIRTPEQLTRIKPQELRDIVRGFAASSDGQAVLMSGTEYELSRVTEWISAARSERHRAATRRGRRDVSHNARTWSRRRRTQSDRDRKPAGTPSQEARQRGKAKTGSAATSKQSEANHSSILRMEDRKKWRFYLDPTADVVDAPSIGPRTAERLIKVGVGTVHDLLQADAGQLADKLQNRRINAETIRQWQHQTILACRIPQLRGHDAQILVALEITTPEALAQADADELWSKVAPFVKSKEGKRIIRNGKEPDLDEVQDWIRWARAARTLIAA